MDALEISLFGGPTLFHLNQGLITAVQYDHAYPFDEASFTAATTAEQSDSTIGFNVGTDIGFFFSDTLGIGALVHYIDRFA